MSKAFIITFFMVFFFSLLCSGYDERKLIQSNPLSGPDSPSLPVVDIPDTKRETREAQRSDMDPGRMHIRAGYYDYIGEYLIILKDNVEIKYQNIELYADRVEFYRDINLLIAEGNVNFIQDNDYINSDKMEINLANNTGIIFGADGYISDTFYIRGDKIIKYTDKDYEYIRSELTSCDDQRRLWFFTSNKGYITRDEYARLRNVILWFGGVPMFYLPYLVYPVRTERTTGFLVPAAGYSARRGWYIKNSFFWAISDYVDTTLSFDYYTRFGHTTMLEFRYVMGEGQAGTFFGTYSREYENQFGEAVDDPAEKYSINYMHRHHISSDLNALVKIEYINVDNYFNQHGWDINYNTRNEINSFFSLTYNTWSPRGSLLFVLDTRQDLREEKGSELSKLPEIKYDILRANLFAGLFFSLNTSITNFYFRDRMFKLRQQSFRYEYRSDKAIRAKSRANFSYPFNISTFLDITPSLNLYGAYYNRTYDLFDENRNYYNNDLIYNNRYMTYYDASITAEGPKFHRVFHFEESRLMHMIYPVFEYRFRPYTDIRDIPSLDGTDRVNPYNNIKYGFTQKFLYKKDDGNDRAQSREIASISIYQYYDYHKKELLPYNLMSPIRRNEKPMSDYHLDINYNPSTDLRLRFSARYDPYFNEMRSYNLDFGYTSYWLRTSVNYSHYNLITGEFDSSQSAFLTRSNRYITSDTSLKIMDLIGLGFSIRYDIDREELRNGMFRIAYLHPCFSAQVAAIKDIYHRYQSQAFDEWRFEFSFLFLNIGSVGSTDVPNDFVEEWGRRN